MKKVKLSCLIVCLLVSVDLQAQVVYISVESLAMHALTIVEGKVAALDVKWDDDHRFIHTFVTVEVSQALKNTIESQKIVIKVIGGTIGEITTYAQNQPDYKTGEHIVVFLQKDDNYYRTFGMDQGKFVVETVEGVKRLRRNVNVASNVLEDIVSIGIYSYATTSGIVNNYIYDAN